MRWLRAIYVSNGLALGSLYGFIPVLLQAKGFSPALVGLTMSLGALAYTSALPVWGHVGDMVSGPRRALQIATVPAAIFAFGFGLPLPVAAVIVCQLVVTASGNSVGSMTDAMALTALRSAPREYSRLRLLTSVAAGGGSIVCGFLYGVAGYVAAPVVYLAAMISVLVYAGFLPLGRDSERHRRARSSRDGSAYAAPEHGRFGSMGEAIKVNPRLIAVLGSAMVLFVGIMAATNFITLRVVNLGGGPVQVGLTNGLGFAAELPGMILAGWLIARLGTRSVLVASSVGFAATTLCYVVIVDPVLIVATRFAAGIFFSGIFMALVLTMSRMLPSRLQATGQALLGAAGFGIGSILANLIGGILYGAAGPIGVFGFAAICAVIGAALGFVAVPTGESTTTEPSMVASVLLTD